MSTAPKLGQDWEQTFRNWSKPSSDTEQQKAENAERMIRDAIRASNILKGKDIEVFAQGSYRNNTNVRQDSDVDICVRLMDVLYTDFSLANGFTEADLRLNNATYTYTQFKHDVETALISHFGKPGVRRGDKAIDVHENTYRLDADVVACFEHRRYTHRELFGGFKYLSGTQFYSDSGKAIINWPHQHYENGVQKNNDTGKRFKLITRAIKRLRNEMTEERVNAATPISSYLIECLIWNVPNEGFGHNAFSDDVRYCIAYLFNETINDDKCHEWGEVNELKYLFRVGQPWSREQAHAFCSAAWQYIGFK